MIKTPQVSGVFFTLDLGLLLSSQNDNLVCILHIIVLIKIAITSIKIVKENLLLIKGGGLLSKLVVVQAGERIKNTWMGK